jgi:anaerobic selenocysteine-containing dehydrogenase
MRRASAATETNSTRAIAILHALAGNIDAPGGNVQAGAQLTCRWGGCRPLSGFTG